MLLVLILVALILRPGQKLAVICRAVLTKIFLYFSIRPDLGDMDHRFIPATIVT